MAFSLATFLLGTLLTEWKYKLWSSSLQIHPKVTANNSKILFQVQQECKQELRVHQTIRASFFLISCMLSYILVKMNEEQGQSWHHYVLIFYLVFINAVLSTKPASPKWSLWLQQVWSLAGFYILSLYTWFAWKVIRWKREGMPRKECIQVQA